MRWRLDAAHAVTRSMTTERQNAKETAARPAHAVTRSIMAERQDAKEMAARARPCGDAIDDGGAP